MAKKCRYSQQHSFLQAHCPNSLEKSIEAIFQFSRLIQYFTLGVSISPCISPASFNSFRCCETVAFVGSVRDCELYTDYAS